MTGLSESTPLRLLDPLVSLRHGGASLQIRDLQIPLRVLWFSGASLQLLRHPAAFPILSKRTNHGPLRAPPFRPADSLKRSPLRCHPRRSVPIPCTHPSSPTAWSSWCLLPVSSPRRGLARNPVSGEPGVFRVLQVSCRSRSAPHSLMSD